VSPGAGMIAIFLMDLPLRLLDLGPFFGPILCIITAVQGLFLAVLDWLQPRDTIDIVPDIPSSN
jgi:hypothetical protein